MTICGGSCSTLATGGTCDGAQHSHRAAVPMAPNGSPMSDAYERVKQQYDELQERFNALLEASRRARHAHRLAVRRGGIEG